MERARLLATTVLLTLLVASAPAAAQIRQQPPPIKPPDANPIRTIPVTRPDLTIESVSITDTNTKPFMTTAKVVVRNAGQADAVFPVGSVILGSQGTVGFVPMTASQDLVIAPGTTRELNTRVADVCARNPTGTVTFTVDPANRVIETNDGNNSRAVTSVGSYAGGKASGNYLQVGASMGAEYVQSNLPAAVGVLVHNAGQQPILLCPGALLFKETQSPLAGTKGLRENRFTGTEPRLMGPEEDMVFLIQNAIMPGDLSPGTYTWSVVVNPNGDIRGSSAPQTLTRQVEVR